MKIAKLFFTMIMLLACSVTWGQNSSNYQSRYRNGKYLFQEGKYKLAMEEFRQLISRTENNPFLEYASYYFALSAYHAGQSFVAKSMFYQIERRHASWERIDEVYLWIAKLNFEEDDYLKAFINLANIKDAAMKNDVDNIKRHFLAKKLDNLEQLELILSKNPYDAVVAEALAASIINSPIIEQDHNLLEFLVTEFSLDEEKYGLSVIAESVKKDMYNVAILLPLNSESIDPENIKFRNNFVLELFEGIKLGAQKVNTYDQKLKLHVFDTKRDSIHTKKMIDSGALDEMDIIIGPLFQDPIELTSNFSFYKKINMVNPLSYNSGVVGNNPFSFLFRPSLETQAQVAADFATKSFSGNKRLRIIYGDSPKDSLLAFNYKERIELDSFEIVGMHKVLAKESRDIINILTARDVENEDIYIPADSLGHLYLASSDDLIIANTISALEARGDNLPVVGVEDWLKMETTEFDQMERLGICFTSPNYIDYTKKEVEEFRTFYHANTNSYPSIYAYTGYELMTFFGKLLIDHGTYFQKEFPRLGLIPGQLYSGFYYGQENDNQHVPIVKFEESELKIINRSN
ncbi:ABC transporter substrate-binding protein [Fulvivirgaceae bacterium BMA10]|uniref:ABC transporter substrate-binding protein n=1 Tax=Splendidivirga corallicola TaxID=3051826 RepID=A0ABT8KR23_9BACT|nr:ABC transporter substrate-binding protein [Fulvivirgaceae bacterium BMA10]